ncbi:MFS transporter [Rhodococcus sp. 06-235-1A]|uniref:MFS transporter n=1 Tax=Rhodococcus sp. 06-235-1A TaxID=2022508 RepID=UPI000B9A94DF|nr:MFS transporter [Rhodococcus sp. 06-235-1A]OZD01738.1 MFS transporter [Rhodococcus sp. 06-235-1A]
MSNIEQAVPAIAARVDAPRVPFTVYILAFTILAFTTSEFMVSGLMNDLARDLPATVPAIGYLIAIYALSMVVLAPPSSILLSKVRPKTALLVVSTVFIIGELTATMAPNYAVIVIGRIVTGAAAGTAYGVTISIAARAVPDRARGRAIGIVMGGNTIGTIVGLPVASFLGNAFGWRLAFAFVALLATVALVAAVVCVPGLDPGPPTRLRSELATLKNRSLWLAYSTSGLLIGSVFSIFSYFSPILTQRAGFDQSTVPIILAGYGLACAIGITVVTRLSDSYPLTVAGVGSLIVLSSGLVFLVGDTDPILVLIGAAALGLAGVSLNPAFAVRVMRVGGTSFAVNTVHTSIICFGIFLGATLGGLVIDTSGSVHSVYYLSLALAAAGAITLLPKYRTVREELRTRARSAGRRS